MLYLRKWFIIDHFFRLVFFGYGERRTQDYEAAFQKVLAQVGGDPESQKRIESFLNSAGLEEEISKFNKMILQPTMEDFLTLPPTTEYGLPMLISPEELRTGLRRVVTRIHEVFQQFGKPGIFARLELQAAEHAVSVLEKPMSEDATPLVIEASLWKPLPLLVLESFVLEDARVGTLRFS